MTTELRLPGYRNLKVWQMAFELSGLIYDVTRKFPKGEEKGLIIGDEAERTNALCNNLWPALGGLIKALQKKLESGDWDTSLGAEL